MVSQWSELDENKVVLRVTGESNDDPDEGYQWLMDNLGGRWLKCSYNTVGGVHNLGGTPFRWTFPGPGYLYFEDIDAFIFPCIYTTWILNKETKTWEPPVPKPDSGIWIWDDATISWKEREIE
jgi:hypothetical protein